MKVSKLVVLGVGVWALALAGILAALFTRGDYQGDIAQLKIDLARPDVLIHSRQLSALPRDLVALPGLRDVLTEDFVQYYEDHPDRLTLEGTLRRLAFEQGLSWQERVLDAVLDAPADLALWSDGKGRLAYAALLLHKNAAAQVLEQLAKVALPEAQLTRAGALFVDGSAHRLYALKLRNERTLLLASAAGRVLVLTHPGMLLDASRQPAAGSQARAEDLLRSGAAPWQRDFETGAMPDTSRHAVMAKASWLSLGYQHFFPQVHALRLDLAQSQWTLSAAAAPAAWNDWPRAASAAWSVLPRGAAFCAALPASWDRAAAPLATLLAGAATAFGASLEPGAGVCWYPGNGLYAPVLALRLKAGTGAAQDAALRTVLEKAASTPKNMQREVAERAVPGGKVWSTHVVTPVGYLTVDDERAHRIAVMRQGDVLLASVDHRALEQAQAVAGKRFPALADEYPGGPLLLAGLPELGRMLQDESLRLTETTPAFRQVVASQLKPRLDAMAAGGRLAFAPAGDAAGGSQWQWKTLARLPAGAGK